MGAASTIGTSHLQLAPTLALAAGNNCYASVSNEVESRHRNGMHARIPSDPSSAFSWEDIRSGSQASCGVNKCYIPSATKHRTGYLILSSYSKDSKQGCSSGHVLWWSWQYARCLATRYGIVHFLLGPEERINVSTQLASRLSFLHAIPMPNKSNSYARALPRVGSGTRLCVQMVKTAPPDGLLVGCSVDKWKPTLSMLPAFANTVEATPDEFSRHLDSSLESTHRMLWHEPCLAPDFQFVLSNTGEIFHIDLDRVNLPRYSKMMTTNYTTIYTNNVRKNYVVGVTEPGTVPDALHCIGTLKSRVLVALLLRSSNHTSNATLHPPLL